MMNLMEAWEAGDGMAHHPFHDTAIIISYVDDHHVHLTFGNEQKENYPVRALGLFLSTIGIKAQTGWIPGKVKS